MRAALLLLLVSLTPLVLAIEIPDVPDAAPGPESGEWLVEGWGNPGAVDHVDAKKCKLMKLIFVPAGKEKAAFRHNTGMGLPKNGKFTLQVYSEKAIDVSLALSTAPAYIYHEAKRVAVKPGWNKLEFDVSAKIWKTASSDWNYTQDVESSGDVRAIDLLVYNQKAAGDVYVLGMHYDPDDATKEAEKLAKDLSLDDADKRAASEKALLALGTPAIEVLSQIAARDDKPEIQIRARLLMKALEPQAAPAPASISVVSPEMMRKRAGLVGETQIEEAGAALAPRAKTASLPEVLADAEKQLVSLRAEVAQLHDQTATLVKTLDEASNLVKKLGAKPDEKAP